MKITYDKLTELIENLNVGGGEAVEILATATSLTIGVESENFTLTYSPKAAAPTKKSNKAGPPTHFPS